jgi:hypothetical protein
MDVQAAATVGEGPPGEERERGMGRGVGGGHPARWWWGSCHAAALGEGLRVKREREREREVWDAANRWMELGRPGEEREVVKKEESSW